MQLPMEIMTNCHVPSLEALINQCCEDYYSDKGKSGEEIQQRQRGYYNSSAFKQFIIDLHCQENLKFLVEIYQYEKIWNKTCKKKYSVLKYKSVSSNEPELSKIDMDSEDRSGGDFYREDRQNSNPSMVSEDYDLDSLDIENLKKELHLTNEELSKNWSILFKKHYDDSDEHFCQEKKECLCQAPDSLRAANSKKIQDYLLNQLTLKFDDIIDNFIQKNSPYEVNLPTEIYEAIMKDATASRILYHSPVIFLKAKCHTLQILRENIYFKFLKYEQREFEKDFNSLKEHQVANSELALLRCSDCNNQKTCLLYSLAGNELVDPFAKQTPNSITTISSPSPITATPNRPLSMHQGSSNSTSTFTSNSNSTCTPRSSSSRPSTPSVNQQSTPKQHHFHRKSATTSPELIIKDETGRSNSNESQISLNSEGSFKATFGAEKIWKKIMKFKINK